MDFIISKQVRVLVNVEGSLREMAASLQYFPTHLQLVMVDRDVQIPLPDIQTLQLRDNEMHIRFNFQGQPQKFALLFESNQDAKELMSHMPLQKEAQASQDFMDKLDFEAKKTPVTTAIIAINIAVFVIMYSMEKINPISPGHNDVFIKWGANRIFETVEEPWRLFTCAWLHFGLLHIACNMYFLHALGRLAEKLIGPRFYVLIYIFSAFTGSLASLIWNEAPVTAVGASGAVFGVVGMIGAFLLTRKNEVPPMAFKNLKNNMLQIVVLNFLIGVSVPAIDNAAHIGGLIGGFIGAAIMSRSLNEEKRKKNTLPKLGLGLVILPAIVFGIWKSGLVQNKEIIKLKPLVISDKIERSIIHTEAKDIKWKELSQKINNDSKLKRELLSLLQERKAFYEAHLETLNKHPYDPNLESYDDYLKVKQWCLTQLTLINLQISKNTPGS